MYVHFDVLDCSKQKPYPCQQQKNLPVARMYISHCSKVKCVFD